MGYCISLAYFRNDLLASAYIPPPHSLNLHTLPHPSKSPHPSPSHLPRTIPPTYPPCPPAATSPKYASLCTIQFTASACTPTNPNTLSLNIFGPSCSLPLLTLPSLPLDKNISINTEATLLLGNLSIQVQNQTWYNEIWYSGQLVDFQLPVDEKGLPYFPKDFEGRVVRWSGFECVDCDAGKGFVVVDGVVYEG